jgi:tight adherence protein C
MTCDLYISPAVLDLDVWDILLSVGMFGSVILMIIAVFGHGGQVRLSPQREAAIATGHTDRRTLFENKLMGPLMWVLLSVAHHLAMPRLKSWLRRTLVSAGSPNSYTPEEYLSLGLLAGIVFGLFLMGLQWLLTTELSIIAFLVGMLAGTGLTLYQVHDKAAKRLRAISKRVPYSLDLIGLAMGAGATFTEAVKTIVREQSEDPFNIELRTLLAEMDLGSTRRKALQNMSDRIPIDSLRSIIASVIQAEELGTPLGDVLRDQATLLRLQRTVRAENAAAVASVRILIPCLLLVIAVILTIFGPAIVRAVRGGLF